jgi:hypothetical protein
MAAYILFIGESTVRDQAEMESYQRINREKLR